MCKILIIDSEVGMLYALQTVMDCAGYQTLVAQTCTEARNILDESMPDLIILSKQYPDETCWRFSADLKNQPATQHIPLIIYGNGAYLEVPAEMKQHFPPDAILMRPASSQALLEKVRSFLSVVHAG